MPDKTSKDRQETVKFERYSSPFGYHTCANRHFHGNKRHVIPVYHVYPYMYMRIAGTGRQALLLKFIGVHPSPCSYALRFY